MTRTDDNHMERALALAETARGATAPNPLVGAVVVDARGAVVGEGHHEAAGRPHAEVVALDRAGGAARGATLYVTLEPCRHHGRTPPCTDAILAAGVRRVVVAHVDPDEKMAGESVTVLLAAGVEVTVGVCEADAAAQNEAYFHHRRTGLPLVVLKAAATFDGRTAAPDGSSQWITGEEARGDVHALRAASDAVVVGAGTVLVDDPRLTARTDPPAASQPARVVVDATGRVPAEAALFAPGAPLIVATAAAAEERRAAWSSAGAEVLDLPPAPGGGVALRPLLEALGNRGMLQVLVEGGATLAGSLLREDLVDRVVLYVGAVCAGGDDARPLFAGPAFPTLKDFARFGLVDVTRFGDDVRLTYVPRGD